MDVPKEILDDIVGNLEMGFKCYIHKQTFEVVSLPDENRFPDKDEEIWEAEIKKISKNRDKYIEIEGMNSFESFRVIKDFVYSLEDGTIKSRLIQAIEERKPFANFKHQIENSGAFREEWFAFRKKRNIDWVKGQLISNNL